MQSIYKIQKNPELMQSSGHGKANMKKTNGIKSGIKRCDQGNIFTMPKNSRYKVLFDFSSLFRKGDKAIKQKK